MPFELDPNAIIMISIDLPGAVYVDYQHSHAITEMQVEDEGELGAYAQRAQNDSFLTDVDCHSWDYLLYAISFAGQSAFFRNLHGVAKLLSATRRCGKGCVRTVLY